MATLLLSRLPCMRQPQAGLADPVTVQVPEADQQPHGSAVHCACGGHVRTLGCGLRAPLAAEAVWTRLQYKAAGWPRRPPACRHMCCLALASLLTPAGVRGTRAIMTSSNHDSLQPLPLVPPAPRALLPAAIDSDYKTAFIPLDTDGQGYLDGQIYVTVEVVVCGGPPS